VETRDDKTLVRLALTGELSAFDALAKRHQPTLLRFLRRRLPAGEVEDAAQDVLVRAYTRLGQCHTAFRAWLLMIAYRESVDRLRRPKLSIVSADEPASHADPSDSAAADETRERLWAVARRTLSDDQYTALWLFYADDLDAKQIAAVMGKSWINVKVMLHRARVSLGKALNASSLGIERSATLAEAGES
jgi:RNA polymerase sigma-70 factor (ECF subfamily)